jgi:4-amino-4-deoxy-L-arabinose transferase-like glycosyltransferase
LILAALIKLFGSYEYIYYLQAAINTLTLLIVYRITRRLSPETNPYIIVFSILIFSLPLVAASIWVLTEGVSAFLLCSSFLLLLKERYAFAGAVMGLAALCRAENLAIAVVLIVLVGNLRHALPFALALSLVLLPWVVRNYSIFGKVTHTDPIYTYLNLTIGTSSEGVRDPEYVAAYRFRDGGTNAEREAHTSLMKRVYFERWREHPFDVLLLKLRRSVRAPIYGLDSFLREDDWAFGRLLREHRYGPVALRLLTMVLSGPVLLGGALTGFLRSKRARLLIVPFVLISIIGFMAYIEQRFLIGPQLLLIPLFIIGVSRLWATRQHPPQSLA